MRLNRLVHIYILFRTLAWAVPTLPNSACPHETLETLDLWQSVDQWVASAPESDGNNVLQTPTKKFGTWIQLKISKNGETTLRRIDHEKILELVLSTQCTRRLVSLEQIPLDYAFKMTDELLEKWLKQNPRTLIFLWSPHMPLSINGLKEAFAFSKKNNFVLLPLLDPAADIQSAKKVALENSLPQEVLTKCDSNELRMRNLLLHFPDLIFYTAKKGFSHIRPGYIDRLEIEKFYKQAGVE